MVDRFALTDLSVRVVGAPMAGGPSTPALAAAVANAGVLVSLPRACCRRRSWPRRSS